MKKQIDIRLFQLLNSIAVNEDKVERQRKKISKSQSFWPKFIFDNAVSPDPVEQIDKFASPQDVKKFIGKHG